MNREESFSNPTCTNQLRMAERQLAAFISAVTELAGPGQAKMSAESEFTKSPRRSTSRDWQAMMVGGRRLYWRIG